MARLSIILAAIVAMGWCQSAPAATGSTVVVTRMHAGPSTQYPIIAHLPSHAGLTIYGCVEDYAWCDVQWGQLRGWVFGGALYAPYGGASYPIVSVGSAIGLGIVLFSVNDYWNRYYVGRPWYRSYYNTWNHRPPPPYWPPNYHRPPPPPPPRPPVHHRPPHHRPPPPPPRPPHNGNWNRPPHNGNGQRPPPNNNGWPSQNGNGQRPPPINNGGPPPSGNGQRPPPGNGGRPPGPTTRPAPLGGG